MLCKTIILSNSQNLNNNPKGILTLSNENNYILGKIRLYNLNTLPKTTKIGLYIDEKVYSSTIDKKPNHYEFVLNQSIDITKSVYCALIDPANNKQVILEGGSFNGFYFTDSPLDAIMEAKDPEIEEQISKVMQDDSPCIDCNCENCEYKRYFYNNSNPDITSLKNDVADTEQTIVYNEDTAHQQTQPIISEQNSCETAINIEPSQTTDAITLFQDSVIPKLEKELLEDLNQKHSSSYSLDVENKNLPDIPEYSNSTNLNQHEKLEFLNDVVYQLDRMFLQYPEDETLENIIPNSRFVSIECDSPYVLGAIYENNIMKYVAYGVPAQYNSLPPKDLGNHYQWLPLNPRDAMSDGYFMIYQNALTGNIVEINFE